MYNSQINKTCLVIGNGPSLKDIPSRLLNTYPTFGSNRIYLRTDFQLWYYVAVNPLVIEQFHEDMEKIQAVKFVSDITTATPEFHKLHSIAMPCFSWDPLRYVYEGYTVTYVMLQLAYYMGFTKVGLVGVDHRYAFEGNPNEEHTFNGDDPNHFDPNYFKGAQWNNPDLKRSEEAYKMAKEAFDEAGRPIINLTPGSALEVFPREDWQTWLPR